jgi:hypothetical protein
MGKDAFRVAIENNGTVVAISAPAPVSVEAYATVQLVPFNSGNGTVQVGNRLFDYTDNQGLRHLPAVPAESGVDRVYLQVHHHGVHPQPGRAAGQLDRRPGVRPDVERPGSDPAYASGTAGTAGTAGTVKAVTVALAPAGHPA